MHARTKADRRLAPRRADDSLTFHERSIVHSSSLADSVFDRMEADRDEISAARFRAQLDAYFWANPLLPPDAVSNRVHDRAVRRRVSRRRRAGDRVRRVA